MEINGIVLCFGVIFLTLYSIAITYVNKKLIKLIHLYSYMFYCIAKYNNKTIEELIRDSYMHVNGDRYINIVEKGCKK